MRGFVAVRELAQRIGSSKIKSVLTKNQLNLVTKVDQYPWTKTWIHLFELPYRERVKVYRERETRETYEGLVAVKDRIKKWNVVPGDLVRIKGETAIREVFGVNKFKSRVYFRSSQDSPESELHAVPYSACQLYVGDRQFPPAPGEKVGQTVPVFAVKTWSSTAKWSPTLGRFDWVRFATKTDPPLFHEDKIDIPWPKYVKPEPPPINTTFDTSEDVVKQITWTPSYIFHMPSNNEQRKGFEDAYLFEINPTCTGVSTTKFDPAVFAPMEYMVDTELSNPHGRTKKLLRARARVEARKVAHRAFVKAETRGLTGRAKKQAVADAEFKWNELRMKQIKDAARTLWIVKGFRERTLERRKKREEKAQRRLRKLQKLQLQTAPNQFNPTALSDIRDR